LVKSQADIRRAKSLKKYRDHEGLCKTLGEEGQKWEVIVQMGLHIGWAIEGAIGSEYKIDASYIGPNVSMTARIEDMCKIYGVKIIICGSVVEHISDVFKQK